MAIMVSEADILRAWELCDGHSDVDRAVLMLQWGFPQRSLPDLAGLTIGERDSLLLTLRQQTFGEQISGSALCPSCGKRSTFVLSLADLRVPPSEKPSAHVFRHADWELHFRLPSSHALRAAVACKDVDSVAFAICAYCVLSARHKEDEVSVYDLPSDICQRLGRALSEADPQSEILLALRCAHCGHNWQSLFDIARFLWNELSQKAQRVFDEVYVLATAYGWSEPEILQLGSVRRCQYLARCGHE